MLQIVLARWCEQKLGLFLVEFEEMEVCQLCLGVLEKFDGKIFEGKLVAADACDVKLY